jgi:hypothetical protein
MRHSVNGSAAASHRVIGEKRPSMLKVDLPSGEKGQKLKQIGGCLDFARRYIGWTVQQLAAALERDEKQVARWMRGEERTQVDVVLCVPQLHGPFVIALARLDNKGVIEVETTIRIRESA